MGMPNSVHMSKGVRWELLLMWWRKLTGIEVGLPDVTIAFAFEHIEIAPHFLRNLRTPAR